MASTASAESKANFKTPSRRDSLRRMQVLQSDAWAQLTSADDAPAAAAPVVKQSPIISQEAYVPLPTQPSSSSIHSGFTPGGPIPNNFSYLSRSNSLATSTRPNRPRGLGGQSTPARSPQLPYSPVLVASSQHPKAASMQDDVSTTGAAAVAEAASVGSPTHHRASASLDMEEALRRTMHARPPSVEEIFAELDAAEANKESSRNGRISSPVKGSVNRRAADYSASLSASDSEPAFSTMRRKPAAKMAASKPQEADNVKDLPKTPATDPRKPGAIMTIESPSVDRVIPRRSKTLSSFPPTLNQNLLSSDERSKLEREKIAEKIAQLPANPKMWTPSQVAVYLSHVLGLTPRPVVEDVTAFVRASRMNGNVFLRLREQDLANAGVNRKWRKLMLESGKVLRRDCVQCQVWGFGNTLEDEDAKAAGERRETASSDEEASSESGRNPPSSIVDVAALRAGYLKVAPTAVSAMRGSVRRIKDRKAVKGMIKAFEDWRVEGDLSEADEDAFVALNTSRARRASYSGSVDSSDDDNYDDDDGESIGSTRSHRERETASIKAIYGAGFVRRRAESYSSLSDAEQEAQAQLDADIEGDRSLSRARSEARRKRLAAQKADDELVNAWIESLTDEEAQALANELEAKDILERGLLKPLIETSLHTKDLSNTSSASSTGSIRDDLKILLGSVNQVTLAQHDLLSVVPSLDIGGELSEASADSPTVEKRESEVTTSTQDAHEDAPARIAHFTPVAQDVLLSIFAESEDDAVEAIRNVEIDRQIDHFLGIKPPTAAALGTPTKEDVDNIPTPQRREVQPSRYADAEDRFDTTRRKKNGSGSSGPADLMNLFPPSAATSADEVHATLKPGNVARSRSEDASAGDEFEISPNGSIRRRKHTNPAGPEPIFSDDDAVLRDVQVATVVRASAARRASVSAIIEEEAPAVEFQPPSVRDIFGPSLTTQPTPWPPAPVEVDDETEKAQDQESEEEPTESTPPLETAPADTQADTEASVKEAAAPKTSPGSVEKAILETSSQAQQTMANVSKVDSAVNSTAAMEAAEEVQDEVVETAACAPSDGQDEAAAESSDPMQRSIPSLTASKLPTPTIHAKRDASVDVGEISGLDLNVAQLEPIEPGGEKLAVPLTTLAPTPDGKGSIKKRSMVLVDRKRFESLARRMGVLEEQLAGLESVTSAASSVAGSQARASALRNMFDAALPSSAADVDRSMSRSSGGPSSPRLVSAAAQMTTTIDAAMASPELAALEREFAKTDFLDEELIDDDDDQEDRWGLRFGAPRWTLGAIPSYMLGLGAGIGFVLVSEVIQRASRFAR